MYIYITKSLNHCIFTGIPLLILLDMLIIREAFRRRSPADLDIHVSVTDVDKSMMAVTCDKFPPN